MDIQDSNKLWNRSILHSTLQLTGPAKENFEGGGGGVSESVYGGFQSLCQ